MSNRLSLAIGLFFFGTACAMAQDIQVDVTYTGSGTVNASHKIYVALWPSADFNSGAPVDIKALDSKKGSVTFTHVQKLPAYVSTAYDPTGAWDAQSGPPSGSSLGTYSTHPPAPGAIDSAPGKTTKVKLTFDDRIKVP